jgi:hypothetical protein
MPMQSLAKSGYSAAAVKLALHAAWGTQQVMFRYALLDNANVYKRDLTNVDSASVSHDALGDVKRKAKFSLKDDGTINFLSDRIKPYVQVWVPANGGWAEFPQGVFLLSTPEQGTDPTGSVVTRDVEAYDQCQVLLDDKVDGKYLLVAGTVITDALVTILLSAGITQYNVAPSTKTLPVDREWDTGTSKLNVVNDLTAMLNYYSIWFDGEGLAIASPYVLPSQAPSEYTYDDSASGVIELGSPKRKQDLFSAPNKWVLTVSQADLTELKSIYINSNPNSPLSTVSRGRTITYAKQVEAADQATLDGLAQRAANDMSQLFTDVTWTSWLMPMHAHLDNYTLTYSRLIPPVVGTFRETSWAMELKEGGRMTHSCRKTETI